MRIVVVGAGIAGLGFAWWARRSGFDVTLVDSARRFEARGHYVALKAAGVEVVREMGLEEACRRRQASFDSTHIMRADGRPLRTLATDESDANLGGYILFRRSELHEALYDAVTTDTPVRFGTKLTSVEHEGDEVIAGLSDGSSIRADLIVGADGIHSDVRRLTFGEGFTHRLGGHYVGMTLDYKHGLATDADDAYFGVGQMAALMPTDATRVSAILYIGDAFGQVPSGDELIPFLRSVYADFAQPVRDVLDRLTPESYLFSDDIAQVRMPHIVSNRVALIGDAAHSPTFMSGMGSALALQDARCLAGSLANKDVTVALASYEGTMQPIAREYATSARQLAPFVLHRSRFRAALRNTVTRFTPSGMLDQGIRNFYHAEEPADLVPGDR
ncbi:MAG TPA: FAD-dependent monooxygenase [Galbitalea sp.]|nr:FAD-dependent monooxygenase [Galbitalea sp.]